MRAACALLPPRCMYMYIKYMQDVRSPACTRGEREAVVVCVCWNECGLRTRSSRYLLWGGVMGVFSGKFYTYL